ncbi:MAG: winged helix-turn-helix transcriptional regulator [Kiritimatiellae bacterium]|nr:winged helix-turn-helix transcriptional regulator [Kiritimatiellia bacterium]
MMYSRKAVETWGRGIKLILDECAKANLPEPQIVAESGYTKTVFMRPAQNAKTKSTLKTTQKTTLKTTQKTTQKILSLIRQNPSITRMQISDAIGLSLEGVKWNLDKLKATGIVRRVGPDRGGHWEIIGNKIHSRFTRRSSDSFTLGFAGLRACTVSVPARTQPHIDAATARCARREAVGSPERSEPRRGRKGPRRPRRRTSGCRAPLAASSTRPPCGRAPRS